MTAPNNAYFLLETTQAKSLYTMENKVKFFSASEVEAIRAHPQFKPEVDRNALCSYLRHNYVPSPASIYKGVKKLPPGTFVRLDGEAQPISYWSFEDTELLKCEQFSNAGDKEILSSLEELLSDAVGLQMQADVPLGAFLSGGIDSSLIVALMQERSHCKVNSFSIGFEEPRFDEAPFARAVAGHLGTNHTELYVTGNQALEVVPNLPQLYDEPFSDSSQIPTLSCQNWHENTFQLRCLEMLATSYLVATTDIFGLRRFGEK